MNKHLLTLLIICLGIFLPQVVLEIPFQPKEHGVKKDIVR